MKNELRDIIYEHMSYIDELLAENGIPIHQRFIPAANLFVEVAVLESTYETKEELLESKAFFEGFLPIFSEWYWDKYGELTKGPAGDTYSGIVLVYGEPLLIKIPATTSKVEVEGETAWITFPDHLQDSEKIEDLIQTKFNFEKMDKPAYEEFLNDLKNTVGLTRALNIDINMASNLSKPAQDLAKGIWSHFEKVIGDILTSKSERSSIACWDIHLAIEKSLKVFISSRTGKLPHGHNLIDLSNEAMTHEQNFSFSKLHELPTDKQAIKLRYAQLSRPPLEVVHYYKIGLEITAMIASQLEHNFGIKNASLLIKAAPWAK